tara:strand:- start:240 stop:893 length:654 start_codon:yes stop_codon:yes gene_type:complete
MDKFTLLSVIPWKLCDESNVEQWTVQRMDNPYGTGTPHINRIVIVDDSRAFAMWIRKLLMRTISANHHALEIKTFYDLEIAEKYIHSNVCTLVFIDNIFTENNATGEMVTHDLLSTEQCPQNVILMSGSCFQMNIKHNCVSLVQKQSMSTELIYSIVNSAGIPVKRVQIKKKLRIKRKLRPKQKLIEWTVGKDPRPRRVRVLSGVRLQKLNNYVEPK